MYSFGIILRKDWFFWALGLLSLCSYLGVLIPPQDFWPAIFASYLIPGVFLLNAFLVLVLVVFPGRRGKMVYPLVNLVIGLPFALITFSYGGKADRGEAAVSVLSFNARLFRKKTSYSEFSFDMIKWAANDTSSIKCFQEYSTNSRWPVLDVTKKISDHGYHSFVYTAQVEHAEHNPGLAIFAKYPILDSGIVWRVANSPNGGIFADLLVNRDTIRVYNVHLSSMKIRLQQYKRPGHYMGKIRSLFYRLKNGAERRSEQMRMLLDHARSSPYPLIICGDLNDTPYSYNYFRLRREFANTFEKAGRGFGFTFNSLLFFLRIDHQFFSEKIEPLNYRVDRSMRDSDHFPVSGLYQLKD